MPQRPPTALHQTAVVVLLFAAFSGPGLVEASDKGDHERALQALQSGQIAPLAVVLDRLSKTQPGQVLEVELEQVGGRWVYEIKLLRSNGQLVKLDVDAKTMDVLRSRTKRD